MSELRCPVHNLPARYRESSEHIYQGRDYGPVFECPRSDCDAYVGTHPDGTAKGTLAGKRLRLLRIQGHALFDKLWKPWEAQQLAYPEEDRVIGKLRGAMRTRAYAWLADQLSMTNDECHIAMMDERQIERVIAILTDQKPTSSTIRAWAKARKEVA